MNLMARRRALMNAQAGDGKIWLFDNGVIGSAAGGYIKKGPDGNVSSGDIVVTIGNTIQFAPTAIAGGAIRTRSTQNVINANGKNLHVIVKTKCSDSRARNCWFYAYASQTVVDTTDVPGNNSGISQFFPNGNGITFYIPYNGGAEKETELVVPITQDSTYISVGFLKQYIFVNYAKITQMWIE